MNKQLNNIFLYLKKTYQIKPLPTKSNWEYWQKYLLDAPNPKYFKISIGARTISSVYSIPADTKIFFAANLPPKIVLPLIREKIKNQNIAENKSEQLYQEILLRIQQQAVYSLWFKNKSSLANSPAVYHVLVDGKDIANLSQLNKLFKLNKKPCIAIFSHYLPYPNLYEVFTETNLLPQISFQKKGSALADLLLDICKLKIPPGFSLSTKHISNLLSQAQANLITLTDTLPKKAARELLTDNFIQNAQKFLAKSRPRDFKEKTLAAIYLDSTPVNFLLYKNNFYLTDIESLNQCYTHHALTHNLIFFLLHFPFKAARQFRKNLIKQWHTTAKINYVISPNLLLSNIILQTLAFSPQILLNSYLETQDESLKRLNIKRFTLHQEIVSYNLQILQRLFSSKTNHLANTLRLFY